MSYQTLFFVFCVKTIKTGKYNSSKYLLFETDRKYRLKLLEKNSWKYLNQNVANFTHIPLKNTFLNIKIIFQL